MAIRQPKPARERIPVSKYHGRRMNTEEYLALPEDKPYLEYVDGVVLQKPMPDNLHRRIVDLLVYLIHGYRREHGGDSGPEGRVRLPDGSGYRLPDAAYWAPGRNSGKDSLPSLVVEVRSEGQSMAELRGKCRAFRLNGVDACWVIDPYARSVEVFEGNLAGARLGPDDVLRTAIMPGFSLTQAELFAELDR